MQINSAASIAPSVIEQNDALNRSVAADQIQHPVLDGSAAGLSQQTTTSSALANEPARASALLSSEAVNDASYTGLPSNLTPEKYEKSLDMAKLASQAYDWDDYKVAETGMGLFKGIGDIKAQDFDTPNYQEVSNSGNAIDWWGGQDQGLDYKVFENKDTGDMVVSFRGTEPLSLEDWVEDAEQIFGGSEQYEQAVQFARDIKSQLDVYNAENGTDKQLTFTGHSLGGGLATAAALATGSEAYAFDAAGLSQATIDNNNLNLDNASQITNFNVRGDFVSDWNKGGDNTTIGSDPTGLLGDAKQYGDTVWLEGIADKADFGGWLVPDWTNTAKLAESVLSHAWHVFTYQLENKNFA